MATQQIAEQQDVMVKTAEAALEGMLTVPKHSKGIVVFAHGSGSSRHNNGSTKNSNRQIAQGVD